MGFVDHVVTPVIGTGWMVAEDIVDRYVIKKIEDRVRNRYVRIAVRGWLNPSRSVSNVLRGRHPWYRDTRAGVWNYTKAVDPVREPAPANSRTATLPRWNVSIPVEAIHFAGGRTCVGGVANVAYRLTPSWELLFEAGGCKMLGLPEYVSGDSLTYMLGPRYNPKPSGRWIPRTHFLLGGHKVSEERILPEVRDLLLQQDKNPDHRALRPRYTQLSQANALAMSFGLGMDLGLNRSVALRLANFEYLHSWVPNPALQDYTHGAKFTAGVVFRVGEW